MLAHTLHIWPYSCLIGAYSKEFLLPVAPLSEVWSISYMFSAYVIWGKIFQAHPHRGYYKKFIYEQQMAESMARNYLNTWFLQ